MKASVYFFLYFLFGVWISAAGEPLKVYILAGQSNMVGDGSVVTFPAIAKDPKTRPLYDKMFDEKGKPVVCERVWISYLNGKMRDVGEVSEGRLTAGFGKRIYYVERFAPFVGPEFAFGVTMQEVHKGPVLLVKVAWGGQNLHTDFRPPSAQSDAGGKRYQQLVQHVKTVLADVKSVVPDVNETTEVELAGFVWFQGWNDLVDRKTYPDELGEKMFDQYGQLIELFIEDLRKDLKAPELPVAIGVIGIHGDFKEGTWRKVAGMEKRMRALRKAMASPAASPKFKGTVRAVETSEFWNEALGAIEVKRNKVKAMRSRLQKKAKGFANEDGRMSAEQQKAYLDKYEREVLTEDELKLWRQEASVGGFVHYFGSAKFYSQAGEAFAKALLEIE